MKNPPGLFQRCSTSEFVSPLFTILEEGEVKVFRYSY